MTDNEGIPAAARAAFRAHLPDLTSPRFTTMKQQSPYEYVKSFLESKHPPWLHGLYVYWRSLFDEPYKGVTNDGASQSDDASATDSPH